MVYPDSRVLFSCQKERNTSTLHTTAWMNLRNIGSKRRESQKTTHHMILSIRNVQSRHIYRGRKWISGCQGPRRGKGGVTAFFFLFLSFLFILRERESTRASGGGQREREGEGESQAGPELSAQNWTRGSNSRTLRSGPEQKPRVSAQWADSPRHPGE